VCCGGDRRRCMTCGDSLASGLQRASRVVSAPRSDRRRRRVDPRLAARRRTHTSLCRAARRHTPCRRAARQPTVSSRASTPSRCRRRSARHSRGARSPLCGRRCRRHATRQVPRCEATVCPCSPLLCLVCGVRILFTERSKGAKAAASPSPGGRPLQQRQGEWRVCAATSLD
jgi:hypothetical protein